MLGYRFPMSAMVVRRCFICPSKDANHKTCGDSSKYYLNTYILFAIFISGKPRPANPAFYEDSFSLPAVYGRCLKLAFPLSLHIWLDIFSQPQFAYLYIRAATNYMKFKNVNRRILRIKTCKVVGQVRTSRCSCHVFKIRFGVLFPSFFYFSFFPPFFIAYKQEVGLTFIKT